jgi:hypothetical protein
MFNGKKLEILRRYDPSETLRPFHASEAFLRGVRGPFGTGKTVAMCWEIFYRACEQAPDGNGKRLTRWCVVRNTFDELKRTAVKTWGEWFPEQVSPIFWTEPINTVLRFDLDDGTHVVSEGWFIAIDRPQDVRKLKGFELTFAWLNEASELDSEVLTIVSARVGRYPPKWMAPITWSGVFMDTNPPDDDHWWYEMAEKVKPENADFFSQPPALLGNEVDGWTPNPEADYAQFQPKGYKYWLDWVAGKTMDKIKIYALGQYASVFDGRPVYSEYEWNEHIHVSREDLRAYPGLPIILGFDYGTTPACTVVQLTPSGSLNVLEEMIAVSMGIKQFAQTVVVPKIRNEYMGRRLIGAGDPSGLYRAQTDERTCMEILAECGIPMTPIGMNNKITRRREAVVHFLTMMRDGKPAFQLSPKCKILRKAFNGGYHYERVQVRGDSRYKDEPKKNMFSHISEALQYAAIYAKDPGTYSIPEFKSVEVSDMAWT